MTDRITYKALSTELAAQANLERGLLRTLVDLIVRPGSMLLGYIRGDARAKYTSVVPFLILTIAFCAAVDTLVSPDTRYLKNSFLHLTTDFEAMKNAQGDDGAALFTEDQMERYTFFAERIQYLLYIVIPIFSLFSWWLFRFWRFTYVEHLVVNAFAVAAGELLSLPRTVLLSILDHWSAIAVYKEPVQLLIIAPVWWLLLFYPVWVFADVSRRVRQTGLVRELPRSVLVFALQLGVFFVIVVIFLPIAFTLFVL